MRTIFALLPFLTLASPAMARDHDADKPESAAETQAETREDKNDMNHSGAGHGQMEHGATMDTAPIPAGPPPDAAFSGPTHAADQFVGPERMAASRADVASTLSGMPVFWFQADRAEYRAHGGKDGYLWDVQGYYGSDIDKIWFKSEGEGNFGEKPESAEVQALWSHAIGPWFDLQTGVRQDLAGPKRTHAVIGVQGLAPYLFEVDAAVFVSDKGDVTARIEAELDQRITQRLILQPRAELNLAAQDIPSFGIGSGVDRIEAGLRLRYEFAREFAPYIGVEQEWKLGKSADYARATGEDASVTNFVAGVRFWF
jgi:copper resistance protein B